MVRIAPKLAAVAYVLWGIVHVLGGLSLMQAAMAGSDAFLQMLTGESFAPTSSERGESFTQEVFAFHAFNICWMGIVSIVVAIRLNWRNVSIGYWINLAVVGLADLGLILFMVIPGVIPLSNAWIGPALFVVALACATVARWRQT
jgi:hypothetical protein